jgi:hypothetical protein
MGPKGSGDLRRHPSAHEPGGDPRPEPSHPEAPSGLGDRSVAERGGLSPQEILVACW